MPRKNRSFTADDLLRFYCANLTPLQKSLVDAAGLDSCGEIRTDEERVLQLLRALSKPPLSLVIQRLPGGKYIADVITLILMITDGRVAVSDVEWARIHDAVIETTRPTLPLLPYWLLPR